MIFVSINKIELQIANYDSFSRMARRVFPGVHCAQKSPQGFSFFAGVGTGGNSIPRLKSYNLATSGLKDVAK